MPAGAARSAPAPSPESKAKAPCESRCATAGGIQALRNFADVDEFRSVVYAEPSFIDTLATSTPIADHVEVDLELRGCPIDKSQLLEVIGAFLAGRTPEIPSHSVCFECKQKHNTCVMVAHGTPCLGPITHAGCGALCPTFNRGCYGCFGPVEGANTDSMAAALATVGVSDDDVARLFHTFNAWAEPYRDLSVPVAAPTRRTT